MTQVTKIVLFQNVNRKVSFAAVEMVSACHVTG